MTRYAAMFARLEARGEGAFVPFCVLGDPTPDESLAIVQALADSGADALELGIPFSDPVADGPTIQAADARALAAGTRPSHAWQIIAELRRAHSELPIGLLVYANLVEARGRDRFYASAAAAGVDSVLVADVPTVEAQPFAQAANSAGIDPVLIATPNASDADLATIASTTRGYTYVVSRTGVTGAESEARLDHAALIAKLSALGAPPSLLGFGISRPDHVRAALSAGARGAICGSAVVALIEQHAGDARLRALRDFAREMKAASSR
jgi:tryptophan synthase alpha chain